MNRTKKSADQFEKSIVEYPNDPTAYLAYADWLTKQGNPLGEFIRIQLALEDFKRPVQEREELANREREMLDTNARGWLGNLAPYLLDQKGMAALQPWMEPGSEPPTREKKYEFAFRRGFLTHLFIPVLTVEFSRTFATAREARMLETLGILGEAEETAGKDFLPGKEIPKGVLHACYYPLLKCPYFDNLRSFQLGEVGPLGKYVSAELLVPLVKIMPKLESLTINASHVDTKNLFKIKSLTHLQELRIFDTCDFPVEILAENPAFHQLRTLDLWPPYGYSPGEQYPYIHRKSLRALFYSPYMSNLTSLEIRQSNMGDEGCQNLVQSGILKHLKILRLESCQISDKGANLLAECPEIRNLEALFVDGNRLTDAGVEALSKIVPRVESLMQVGPDEYVPEDWLNDE